MKVSLNWLRELVEFPPTVEQLVDLLTMAGVEVEGIEKAPRAFIGLLRGENFGKLQVKLGADPERR